VLKTIRIEEIKKAIASKSFSLVYQAILSDASKEVVKYEALLRLSLLSGEIVLPDEFFPIMDTMGKSHTVVATTLRAVIKTLEETDDDIVIAINISHLDIEHRETRRVLLNTLLDNSDTVKDRLVVEIVESHKINDIQKTKSFCNVLSELDIKLSLDDFGTEHSNFYILSLIKFDFLKIDGHFIKNMACQKTLAIIKSIITLCKDLGIPIIAEHIEDEETHALCKELGIDYFQGFFFSVPSPMLQSA
jgi:EAL domain-containing protein (putative c-di-GMP-specific phosphodiesterase class I)